LKPLHHALALAAIAATLPAHAVEFHPTDSVSARIDTTVTFGTMIRTENPDPKAYSYIPSSTQSDVAPGSLLGQTGGSDLNTRRGDVVSTPLKVVSEADVHNANFGAFVRGAAWTDFTLGHDNASYGNFVNAYATDAPLSDHYFARSAKFDGAEARDAYVYAKGALGDEGKFDATLGRTVLSWGNSVLTTGGINSAINPLDYAAQGRPGSLPQEAKVPMGMLDLRVALGHFAAEGFVPFESRTNVLPGCGTFFDIASLLSQGCMLSGAISAPIPGTPVNTVSSLTEKSILASGYYVHRTADIDNKATGQFGLALRYDAQPLATQFSAYAMDTNSTNPYIAINVEDVNGATLPAGVGGALQRLTNPTGLRYHVEYPKDNHLYGLSFDTRVDPSAHVFGEAAYRPNQPLAMNANDLLVAFLLRAPNSLLQQTHDVLALPAGSDFQAWDRFGVTTASLGTSKVFSKVLGAERISLAAELGGSHVGGLPDPSVMRYGRPLSYGLAPYLVNGTLTPCSEASPGLSGVSGKTCTHDGFITQDAWGLRMRAASTWNDVVAGAALTPSLYFAQDVRGYSYDGTFSQGRRTVRAGVTANWGKTWFTEVAYTAFSGGRYNLLTDRDNATVVVGTSF
jgi:hypothetical protein